MQRTRLVAAVYIVLILALVTTWLFAAEASGLPPVGNYAPHRPVEWRLSGPNAAALRRDAFERAAVRLPAGVAGRQAAAQQQTVAAGSGGEDPLVCRFLNEAPSGTSAKFDCALDGGEIIKVKYSRNPEIHAETAAARLLQALGYAADDMEIVPRLRCYGCPRYPFFASQLLWLTGTHDLLAPHGYENGYTDFEWVAVERRFDAPAIETDALEGWAWFELETSKAARAELDAFRLLAVFLAHWDNKADNQRLVCLDEAPVSPDRRCTNPLLMIQDLGATFGPVKVNLAGWREWPVWADRTQCLVSMRALPWKGATFTDARISEEGRLQLGRQLAALSPDAIRDIFDEARFPEFHSGTDDGRDLEAWVAAFRWRVQQILTAGPCTEGPQVESGK